jgi:hypothetical protein
MVILLETEIIDRPDISKEHRNGDGGQCSPASPTKKTRAAFQSPADEKYAAVYEIDRHYFRGGAERFV